MHNAYKADNLEIVICRSLISVDWEGYLHDCNFNQMLGLHSRSGQQLRWRARWIIKHEKSCHYHRRRINCGGVLLFRVEPLSHSGWH
ncbi:MAG: DUF3641 domain-containing protein [Paralcaligenes sp.]